MLTPEQGAELLALARQSIASAFGAEKPVHSDAGWLNQPGSTFVSLHQQGDLRGCVGNIRPVPTLFESVTRNARAAAFDDSRFKPLDEDELAKTKLEVTVMSPLERLNAKTEDETIAQLRPGTDGVVLNYMGRSSVFIPQMWEQLPNPKEFLSHLKRKSRFPTDWPDGMTVDRFTAEYWEES
jgi:AmmeMemoRadiSam system protein A